VLGDKMTDRTGKFISDKLLGWIFFIWLVVSFIGFSYTIFYILVYTNLSSQSLILSLVLLIMGLFGIIFETFIIVKERRRDE